MVAIAIYLYVLYLVWCAKGKYVCSDEYHAIIAQTPQIKYKTPIFVKVFGVLLLVIFVVAVLEFFFLNVFLPKR